MTAQTQSMHLESINFAKLVLNEYLESKATIKNVTATLKRNDIELRCFNRGGGIIRVSLKVCGKYEIVRL